MDGSLRRSSPWPRRSGLYAKGSAYAEFQENDKGSISPGKLADMVILDRDIFAIDPKGIRDAKVVTTIVGGRIVWQSSRRLAD